MQNSGARPSGNIQNTEKKTSGEVKTVTVSEADQLSPVALKTSAANRLKLNPLEWINYDSTPASVYAKNTGFTVMIQASFSGEEPYLCSGPLTEKYKFSQIHFHWGEHDETGSGHSVDGVRFPLEMHVVHVKKDCASFSEASGTKDGIAIAVHLFTLKEERNTSLDQLTAVLQFIQKPNCCARLYHSSLSEMVHPFSNDYFLYWGAVPGSGQQRYRIVWLVSRQVLPVSSQQLHQFRELIDGKGNYIWSNSNRPHPLGDRSLFLVSPSEKSDEAMFGISRHDTRSVVIKASDRSIEIQNAEFKSLAALQDTEVGSCAICPHPNHKTTNPRITEGDHSKEETSINLGILREPELDQRTGSNLKTGDLEGQATNNKNTDCGNFCTAKYIPSQNMYSVIAVNEDELHLKRKPLVVRKSDPSTEQACVILTTPPSVHSAHSAPSLTTWGPVGVRKECTNLSDANGNKESSEIKDHKNRFDFSGVPKNNDVDDLKIAEAGNFGVPRNFKDAETQRSGNVIFDGKEFFNITVSQEKPTKVGGATPGPDQEKTSTDYKSKETRFYKSELSDDELKTEYLLVKQAEPKKSFYKIVGEFLLTPDSKRTFIKKGHYNNGALLSEIRDNTKQQPTKQKTSSENIVYKKIHLSFPSSSEEKTEIIENRNNVLSDKNEDSSRKYYVTKITPVEKSQHEGPNGSSGIKYYAQPVLLKNDITAEKASQPSKNISNSEYINNTRHQKCDNVKLDSESQNMENIIREQKLNIIQAKINQIESHFIDVKTRKPLENNKPSDHLLMRKKVQLEVPDKSTANPETEKQKSSSENETCITNYTNSVPSLHETPNTTKKDLKYGVNREISLKIMKAEKSQTIYQIKRNIVNQNEAYNLEASSNEHKEQSGVNKNQSNNSNKKKIKLAISFRSHGENLKPNEVRILKNITLDENEAKENKATKPLFVSPQMQEPLTDPKLKNLKNLNVADSQASDNNEIVIKEARLENTVYSQKFKKTMTTKETSPTYKMPHQSPPILKDQSSSHLVTIKKVEIPDPYYLTRVPRLPLVEYEAVQIEPNKPAETVQTEEFISKLKTTKIQTYASIKKSNRKTVDDNSVPMDTEPTRSVNTKDENRSRTKTADSLVRSFASTSNPQNANLTRKESTKQNKSNHENTVGVENEILQQGCMPDDERNEVKKTRIVIGSHQPSKLVSKSQNLVGSPENVRDQTTSTESVISQQIHKSQAKLVDAATSHHSGFLPFTSGTSYTDIDEEPTKDTGTDTNAEAESTIGSQEQSLADVTSIEYDNTGTGTESETQANIEPNKPVLSSDDEVDRSAVVYIHRGDMPISSTESVRSKELEVKQETKSEKLVQSSKIPSEFRKAISDINQPREEIISTQDYCSDEKDTDSSHCNITFKSETKMELPHGQTALVRSTAEVKFKPSKKSGNSNTTPDVKSSAKVVKDQAINTTEDKCCSAIELRGKIEDSKHKKSADTTSTSVEDDAKEIGTVNYSPVRIKTDETEVKILPPIEFIDHWSRPVGEDALLENNGKTVRATFLFDTNLPRLRGGPLESDYVFAELHFHWGRKDCCGAEHIIDDKRHSMEAHFLYFKEDYKTVKEALTHEDGFAMVAVQLNVSGPPHPLFGQLIKDISLIKEAETGVYVPGEALFSWIKQSVEEAKGYFSYKGTLTSAPPYVEAVTWIVFQDPITICCQQSLEFRKLMSQNGEPLLKTFRPPRPSNNRTIFFVPS